MAVVDAAAGAAGEEFEGTSGLGVGVPGAGSVVKPGVSVFDMILVDIDDVVSERETLDEVSLTL